MEELIFTLLVLAVGVAIHQVVLRLHSASFERRYLSFSFAAHVAAAIGLVLVYRYYYTEGGDMISYHYYGVPIADALRYDFGAVAPEVVKMALHLDNTLPFDVVGVGSTGTMQAVTVWLLFLLGNSLFASALFIAIAAYGAKVLIYRALRPGFAASQHPLVLLAAVLSPSAVVWTSALLKEPVLMVLFGPVFLGLRWILEGRRLVLAITVSALGGYAIALLKPYVLLTLVIAGGIWILWARIIRARGAVIVRPLYLGVAAAIILGGVTVVSALVPGMSPDTISESMTYQRRVSAGEAGRSNFYLEGRDVDPQAAQEEGRSLRSQLTVAPLALVTALFRPFLFESLRVMQLLNAIEMTWMMILFIQVLRRNSLLGLLKRLTASPTLMFCFAFTLVLALGTGLSTANLGALSRYRAPMMPFFLLLLLILRVPEKSTAPTTNPVPAPLTTSRA
ncbi:MAG: hypothetical protein AMXMBFR34_26510 [Myxococcaceae bacterium]